MLSSLPVPLFPMWESSIYGGIRDRFHSDLFRAELLSWIGFEIAHGAPPHRQGCRICHGPIFSFGRHSSRRQL